MNILFISELYPKDINEKKKSFALHNFVKYWINKVNIRVIRPYYGIKFSHKKIIWNGFKTYTTIVEDIVVIHTPVLKIPIIKKFYFPKLKQNYLFDSDLIIGHHLIGVEYAYMLGIKKNIPYVLGIHNSNIIQLRKNPTKYYKPLVQSKLIICRSYSIKKMTQNIFPQFNDNKIFVANSGISRNRIASFDFFVQKQQLFTQKSEIHFITVARLQKLKNIDINLKVLSKLTNIDWTYEIIGEGEEYNSLLKLTYDLNISEKIKFRGWLKHEEIDQLLKKSDIFLMVSAPETFGLSYLEAMAKACIVIGAKGWGIDGIIQDNQNGFLCNPRNVNDLKEKIDKILAKKKYGTSFYIYKNMYNTICHLTEQKQSIKYLNRLLSSTSNI